jgi:pimeloyl-ACP methyl ester carboxylesterase
VTVVAIHGLSANKLNWAPLADALAGRADLVARDLRGRGTAPRVGPYGMREHADDVAGWIHLAGGGPAVVVGHSMGAYIAEQVAVRHPELVERLVLVDGGFTVIPPGTDLDALLELVIGPSLTRLRDTESSYEAYTAPLRAMASFAGQWNDYVDAYFRYDHEHRPDEAAVRTDYTSMADPTLMDELAAIRCPVHLLRAERGLLITGAEPPLIPDEWVALLRKQIPQLTDEVVPGTNHYTIGLSATGGQAVAARVL